MDLIELEQEACVQYKNGIPIGLQINFLKAFDQKRYESMPKEEIVRAARALRERVLLWCDDVICFAREEGSE